MVAPAATSPLDFAPGDTIAEQILIDLSSPDASLASVAAKHHIPIATLSLWLTKPETQALLHAIESGGYAHTRLAAALNLSAAVPVLLQILSDFRTLSQSTTDLTDPAYQRASVSARKAAWMLLRLARAHPLTPAQLSAARDVLDASGSRRSGGPERRAHAVEVDNPSTSTTTPSHPAAAQTSPHPFPPTTPSPTPPAIELPSSIEAPCAVEVPAPTPAQSTSTDAPIPSTSPSTHPQNLPSTTPPDDLSDLVAKLATIAESLGIDISQLDDLDDLDDLDNLEELDELMNREDHVPTAPNNATGPPDPVGTPARQSA
jgi:hypothetical protein